MRWVLGEGERATLSICGMPGSITNVGAGLAPGWPVAPPASRLLVLQLRQKPRPTLRRVWGARLPRRPEEPGFRRRSRALASASLRPGAGRRRRPLHGLVREAASCPPWGPASGVAAAGGDRREPGQATLRLRVRGAAGTVGHHYRPSPHGTGCAGARREMQSRVPPGVVFPPLSIRDGKPVAQLLRKRGREQPRQSQGHGHGPRAG